MSLGDTPRKTNGFGKTGFGVVDNISGRLRKACTEEDAGNDEKNHANPDNEAVEDLPNDIFQIDGKRQVEIGECDVFVSATGHTQQGVYQTY